MSNDAWDDYGKSTEQDELNRLRAENERLQEENKELQSRLETYRLYESLRRTDEALRPRPFIFESHPACNTD